MLTSVGTAPGASARSWFERDQGLRSSQILSVVLDRVEAPELLGMTLAHLNDAEARAEVSPRVPLLMAIRDKLALALREEP